jgi:UDP-galactopyranose mutase
MRSKFFHGTSDTNDLPAFMPAALSEPDSSGERSRPTLVCFSHLRWNFVYQRPQHLLSRFARMYKVYYFEEPVSADISRPYLEYRDTNCGVCVVVPQIPAQRGWQAAQQDQRILLDALLKSSCMQAPVLWYYTPMSLAFSDHVAAGLVVYDCMDELAAFRGAPPQLVEQETRLLDRADVVFTGGYSLYEAKRRRHPAVHLFPSSVDVEHFKQARNMSLSPPDQESIARPRLGFYGVLDERFDTGLVAEVAQARPQWQLVFIGPVVKIDAEALPRAPNIHYLGPKPYEQLPAYLGGWDVALMPFAINAATRFISPTKTPEYLAGGRPVVSTPIADVARAYGHSDMVRIAAGPHAFIDAMQAALADSRHPSMLDRTADALLDGMSWDRTHRAMHDAMEQARPGRAGGARCMSDNAARVVPLAGTGHSRAAPRMAVTLKAAHFDYLIVGAGFAGSVVAERLAADLGKRVLVVDKRPHIGGNTYDFYNDDGVLVHRYGPHIFHTNSDKVVGYLSRFTDWRPYQHRVLASVDDMLVPMPINLKTLSLLYSREFTAEQAKKFLAARAQASAQIRTSEDVVVSQIGRELYEKFFRGYTRKQWGLDPSQLDGSVAARVPTRTSHDDRYFTDTFQAMPSQGYTRMFQNMLTHPNITVVLDTDFRDLSDTLRFDRLIYTGPIDEYFGWRYGRLPYRSLKFHHKTLPTEQHQPVGVVNYPSEDVPYTRITEYKHLTGQRHEKTSLTYEYPCAEGDPYYPIPTPRNAELFSRYQALADQTPDVYFVGRLATYRYYNMDQVVAQALAAYNRIASEGAAPPARKHAAA